MILKRRADNNSNQNRSKWTVVVYPFRKAISSLSALYEYTITTGASTPRLRVTAVYILQINSSGSIAADKSRDYIPRIQPLDSVKYGTLRPDIDDKVCTYDSFQAFPIRSANPVPRMGEKNPSRK